MDNNQRTLYLTNEMTKKISESKSHIMISKIIEGINVENVSPKEEIILLTEKMNSEDYIKEMIKLKEQHYDLKNNLDKNDFISEGIINGNINVIESEISRYSDFISSLDKLLKNIRLNKKLK